MLKRMYSEIKVILFISDFKLLVNTRNIINVSSFLLLKKTQKIKFYEIHGFLVSFSKLPDMLSAPCLK